MDNVEDKALLLSKKGLELTIRSDELYEKIQSAPAGILSKSDLKEVTDFFSELDAFWFGVSAFTEAGLLIDPEHPVLLELDRMAREHFAEATDIDKMLMQVN